MDMQEARERFGEADRLFRDGHYREALEILNALDATYPETKGILYAKALCLHELGQDGQSLGLCDVLIAKFGHQKSKVLRGQILAPETRRAPKPAPLAPAARAPQHEELPPPFRYWVYAVLGVVAIVACALPVIVPGFFDSDPPEITFVNFAILRQGGVSALLKFIMIYPLLAGVAALVLGKFIRGVPRGAALLGTALLPIVILMVSSETRQGVTQSMSDGAPGVGLSGALSGLATLVVLVGWAGLFVMNRSVSVRPESRFGVLAAAVSGVIYLVWLVLPLQPKAAGYLPIVGPFKMIFASIPVWQIRAAGVISLVIMGLLAAASVFSLVNLKVRNGAERGARRAFLLWMIHFGVLVTVALVVPLLIGAPWSVRMAMLLGLSKMALIFGGFLFLILVGGTDLVVGFVDRSGGS